MPISLTIPMILPTTLALAAAAAFINFWLMVRISQIRYATGINVGDGGNEALGRRMRAQANFIENTPITLILLAAVELSGKGSWWLSILGAVFMLGRVAHAIGMDGGRYKAGRSIGALTAVVTQLGLAVFALTIALHHG
jgi:uncharacterized membrane protein YecN with MAPEG domain